MSFEFAGYQQRSERFQEELEAPMEDVLGATAEQAFTESPINSIRRFSELANANISDERLDAVVARQRLKDAGLEGRLTIPDTGIATPALDILMDRKKEEIRRQDILSRAPKGIGRGAQQLGMAFAASALDPLNIGLAFVPVVGQARYLRYLANARGVLGRTAVRAGVGAAEGAAGAAIVEPLIYAAKSQEQADYDMQDSLLNIAFGTVFGGGLHVLGGLASDVGKALTPTRVTRERIEPTIKFEADSPAARVDAMPLPEREVAMRTAVSQAMTGKAVDVELIVSAPRVDSAPAIVDDLAVAPDDQLEPRRLIEVHEVRDQKKLADLVSSMTDRGWQGRPILAWDSGNGVFALTGSHRLVAAKKAGIDVPVVYVDKQAFEAKLEESNITADELIGSGDDRVESLLRESGDIRAADLMSREMDELGPKPEPSPVARGDIGAVRAVAERQASPESEVTADVPAAESADRQLAENPKAPDPVAEQEALLADELLQLKEAARVADIDVGDDLAEFDEAIKQADEYGKAARAAVICGMAH